MESAYGPTPATIAIALDIIEVVGSGSWGVVFRTMPDATSEIVICCDYLRSRLVLLIIAHLAIQWRTEKSLTEWKARAPIAPSPVWRHCRSVIRGRSPGFVNL